MKSVIYVIRIVAGLVAAVAGFALARELGMNLLIPAVGAVVVWAVLWKAAPAAFRPMVPAFAVQAGHGLWILSGFIYVQQTDLIIDIAILAGGLVWLLLRPGWPPVIFLLVFQLISLGVNLYVFQGVPEDSPEETALVTHILLRLAAISLLIYGMRLLTRSRA